MKRDEFIDNGANPDSIEKRAADGLDYTPRLTAWLADSGGDAIASVAWTVPAGITQNNATNTTTTATIWLSGGTAGQTYRILCRVTTAAGRIKEIPFDVYVRA